MRYEVWITQGQGGVAYVTRPTLKKALAFVRTHSGEGSFAIKRPDGKWHKWGSNG